MNGAPNSSFQCVAMDKLCPAWQRGKDLELVVGQAIKCRPPPSEARESVRS